MKILTAIAGTALSATLLSGTPSQAQFFDPLFTAPAAAAAVAGGIVGGTVGTAANVATGGYYGNQYNNGFFNNGYGAGYPTAYGTGFGGPAYDTGFWFDTPSYVQAPGYAESTTTYYDSGSQPVRTGRSAAARRNYKSSRDNQYQ